MLSPEDQLTELVRNLESQNHVFSADPLLITEKLQRESGTNIQKLHWRAERIDSNGKLSGTLRKIDTRIKAIIFFMSIAWCVSGFLGLFALLQANVVNFFYVLVCLLGFHTIMLVGWLVYTLFSFRENKPSLFASLVSPSHLIRGKDDVTVAAVDLYERQLQHTGMRWYLGKISHQLWLATLAGMMFALIVLLLVKNYSFTWESTLLSGDTVATLVRMMAWLPDMVGFPTPTVETVIESQQQMNSFPQNSFNWAMLLIGSLLMYGIVPRAIAWVLCALMFNSKKMRLDLKLPYYQKIINFWQRQVIDEDDFKEKVRPVAPKAKIADGKKLVALLEYPHTDEHWYQFAVGHQIDDFGILDDRDDMDRLATYLESHNVQVVLGIPPQALPDRGTLRKLDKIATLAQKGLVVQLLDDSQALEAENALGSSQELKASHEIKESRKSQWQEALAARQIGLVETH